MTRISDIHGATIFRGTVALDGDDWTLEQAAKEEARCRRRDRHSTTTVSPSNGYHVAWDDDCDADARAEFEAMVARITGEGERSPRTARETLTHNIRRLLDNGGFTVDQLAEHCRVHPVTVRRWISAGDDYRFPNHFTLSDIASFFGVALADLFAA